MEFLISYLLFVSKPVKAENNQPLAITPTHIHEYIVWSFKTTRTSALWFRSDKYGRFWNRSLWGSNLPSSQVFATTYQQTCLLLSTSIADTNMFKTNMTNSLDTDNISTSSGCLWPLLSGGTAVGLGHCGVVTHSRAQCATCIAYACEQRTRRPIDWWRKNSSM